MNPSRTYGLVREIRKFIIGGGEGITGVVSAKWTGKREQILF
jgi:hypothetical protein